MQKRMQRDLKTLNKIPVFCGFFVIFAMLLFLECNYFHNLMMEAITLPPAPAPKIEPSLILSVGPVTWADMFTVNYWFPDTIQGRKSYAIFTACLLGGLSGDPEAQSAVGALIKLAQDTAETETLAQKLAEKQKLCYILDPTQTDSFSAFCIVFEANPALVGLIGVTVVLMLMFFLAGFGKKNYALPEKYMGFKSTQKS